LPSRSHVAPPQRLCGGYVQDIGTMSVVFSVLAMLQIALCAVLIAHVVLQLSLTRSYLRKIRQAPPPQPAPPEPTLQPFVTVQLPVFNERHVIERLIDQVAGLRYPRERLEIQVLDDSDDETVALAAAAVAKYRARGLDIHHLRRSDRADFKAGALRHGLARAKGEFIAIFDADFLPDADFLHRTLPCFADPGVGMVQTRWRHANRDHSLLTRVQGLMLDTHLTVEQAGRAAQNCFFNFNGTSGIWRAAAIRDAGDWSGATLTEDLDLSYRAQLRGWRFRYLHDSAASGDLPDQLRAFRSQQHRWIKGGAQCAARLLGRVLTSDLGWRVKLQACEHLLETSMYLAFLLLVVLTVPMAALDAEQVEPFWAIPIGLFVGSMSALMFVYLAPQRALIGDWEGWLRFVFEWSAFVTITSGLAVHNGLAALSGLLGRGGEFVRTPKRNTATTTDWDLADRYLVRGLGGTFALELGLWLCLGAAILAAADSGTLLLMFGPLVAFCGLTYVLVICVRDALSQWRSAGTRIASGPRVTG
jgi:cellulose synthase/poly-beta-1,6-N-acetylglucosamine synthase-like glycosyltransferase